MDQRIAKGLEAQFDKHRIVFWYDAKSEMRDAFDSVELAGVEKVVIENNEFGLKYRILRQELEQKFLIFKNGPEPEKPTDNWLFDVQMASGLFQADQISMWLGELGLGPKFRDLIEAHQEFFRSGKRVTALAAMLNREEDPGVVLTKMICIACGAERSSDEAVEQLLGDLAAGRDESLKLLERSQLLDVFWKTIDRAFGYGGADPDLEDFALELFKTSFERTAGRSGPLSDDALVFFNRWKKNRHCADDFETLSEKFSEVLSVADKVRALDFRHMGGADAFEAIDLHLVASLAGEVANHTINFNEVKEIIDARRHAHWFARFEHAYLSIQFAAKLFQLVAEADLHVDSFDQGLQNYAGVWFQIDQTYRKHVFHARQIKELGRPARLMDVVENFYTNKFLNTLNDNWQRCVDGVETWRSSELLNQMDFYSKEVGAFRRKDQKAIVIISDAMRYEVGEELARRIRGNDRFDAQLTPALSALPSYTQLGMAALLPNEDLSFAEKQTGEILEGGFSTQGSVNREKILAKHEGDARVHVMKADDLLNLTKDDAREITRENDVVYIYHNQIDAIGDKPGTEERTFDAAEDAIQELVEMVRKLTSANASSILITADHGFLFQQREIEESSFLLDQADGKNVIFRNRRFILGRDLSDSPGFKKFSANQLGLSGEMEVLIPKSINRLRRQGSGSRFVHGGASLQEIVVPVLRIRKSRKTDIVSAEVEIHSSKSAAITSNQIAVKLFQSTAVTDKCVPRDLFIGLYASDGTLISERHQLTFDSTSNDTREREQTVQLLLSREADAFNGQDVYLKLQERHGKTQTFKDYRSVTYSLRPRISRDFDF